MPFPRTWPENQANEYSILRAAATSQAPPPSRNWVAMYTENRGPSRPFLEGLDQILCNRGWFWVDLGMGVTAAHPDIARPLWPLCQPDPRLLYEPGRGVMDINGRCISPEPAIFRTTAAPDPQGEMLQRKTLDELITDLKAAESELQAVRAARLPPPPPRLLEAINAIKRSLAASAMNFVGSGPDPLLETPVPPVGFLEFSSGPSLEEQRSLLNLRYIAPAAEKLGRQIENEMLALEKSAFMGPQKKKQEPKAPALDPFARTPRRFLKRDEK